MGKERFLWAKYAHSTSLATVHEQGRLKGGAISSTSQ